MNPSDNLTARGGHRVDYPPFEFCEHVVATLWLDDHMNTAIDPSNWWFAVVCAEKEQTRQCDVEEGIEGMEVTSDSL